MIVFNSHASTSLGHKAFLLMKKINCMAFEKLQSDLNEYHNVRLSNFLHGCKYLQRLFDACIRKILQLLKEESTWARSDAAANIISKPCYRFHTLFDQFDSEGGDQKIARVPESLITTFFVFLLIFFPPFHLGFISSIIITKKR